MFEKFIETLVALTAAINKLADAYAKGNAAAAPAAADTNEAAPTEAKGKRKQKTETPAADSSPATPAPGASAAQAPAAPAANPTPAAPAANVPDAKEVVAAAQAFLLEVENQDGGLFKKLAEKYGVERISLVAADKRAELIATLKDALEKAKASKTASAQI